MLRSLVFFVISVEKTQALNGVRLCAQCVRICGVYASRRQQRREITLSEFSSHRNQDENVYGSGTTNVTYVQLLFYSQHTGVGNIRLFYDQRTAR